MATTAQQLYEANKSTIGNNPNLIIPGQNIILPDGNTHTVVKGDNLTKIAKTFSSQDTTVNPDEQAVLESWQADNRAQLQLEEANNNNSSSAQPVDPTTLEGFGVQAPVDPTTLEGYGVQAPVDPTTLEGYGVGDPSATEGVGVNETGATKVDPSATEGYGVNETGASGGAGFGFNPDAEAEASAAAQVGQRKTQTKKSESISEQTANSKGDWRLRLSLADHADYFYNVAGPNDLLYPLKGTKGVVFPYTPTIQMAYKANYDTSELTHSNYKMYFYKSSQVDDIVITADFTAQDTYEANYLLAVLHFFKTVTKMFYGQDSNPIAGTPPPLVYLSGYGAYQFDHHPLVVSSFSYTMPNDVDYIRAGSTQSWGGTSISTQSSDVISKISTASKVISKIARLLGSDLKEGAVPAAPNFSNLGKPEATYVPTKIQLSITLLPIVTRKNISNNFSLRDYATGKLLQGSKRPGGGIW